jgi:hypothetical protein
LITYGLAPLGDEPPVRLLRERTMAGLESHLTLRDLHRMTWRLHASTEVFVCENPRVVEAAADHGCRRPLVCVFGNPTTTALTLLDALHAADYAEHVAAARERGTPLRPLSGSPVDAVWDPELTPAMTALDAAVHEESALELLLTDLR